MPKAADLPVVIVGAGPVGMGLAAALVCRGIEVLVIEKESQTGREWRASTFHPPTLEQLASVGLADEMVAAGLVADRYQIRDRRLGKIAEFDYSVIEDDTPYPFRLQLEQYKLVELAGQLVRRSGRGEIRLSSELVSIDQSGGRPVVTVNGPEGITRIEASFVVGADGARSTTRKLLGLGFEGWTYRQKFLLISTDMPFDELLPDLCYVNYIADPDEFVMLLRIPEVWRVLVPVSDHAQAGDVERPDHLRNVLSGIAGAPPSEPELLAHQLYNVHQRVTERLYSGRVILMGDAAHVNSPMGGFGLNSGLHDAFDLAPRLERLLDNRSNEGDVERELSAYSDIRRSVALEHVRQMSHSNTEMLMRRDEQMRREDRERLKAIAADPERSRQFLLSASMITAARQYRFGELQSGTA